MAADFVKFSTAEFSHTVVGQSLGADLSKLFGVDFGHFVEGTSAAPDVPQAFLLDDYPNASAAFSLRQLRTGVTNVVRVRRSQDDAEQDFTAAEITDGTLASWVGVGNDGFVSTWYDQSGSGNDEIITVVARQRQIINDGAVITKNGKAALATDATMWGGVLPNITHQVEFTAIGVFSRAVNIEVRMFSNNAFNLYLGVTNLGSFRYRLTAAVSGGNVAIDEQVLAVANGINASSGQVRLNGQQTGFTDSATFSPAGTGLGLTSQLGSFALDGLVQEMILYNESKQSDLPQMEMEINDYYGIY
jgi:hypothetical protein